MADKIKCARTFQTMRKRLRVRPAYDLFINACTQINQIYDGYGKGNDLLKEAYMPFAIVRLTIDTLDDFYCMVRNESAEMTMMVAGKVRLRSSLIRSNINHCDVNPEV